MNVYFIPGLGADARIFRRIELPTGFTAIHLDWLRPQANEPLDQYALRLAEPIDSEKTFGIVGLSLGGMIATEIANRFAHAQLILISSIATSSGLPPYYKFAGKLNMHKHIPIRLIKFLSRAKRLVMRESAAEKKMLREMIANTDPQFVRWALGAVLNWRNENVPEAYLHIHGTSDGVLPQRYARPHQLIEGGSHLMVLHRAAEINRFISDFLVRKDTR